MKCIFGGLKTSSCLNQELKKDQFNSVLTTYYVGVCYLDTFDKQRKYTKRKKIM